MKLEKIKIFLSAAMIFASGMFFSFSASAQDTKVNAVLDSNAIQIGQLVKLQLSIQYRVDKGKPVKVLWPEVSDTIRKEIEVVGQTKIDTVINKSDPFLFTLTKTLYLTSFDSGYWAIPPFKFKVNTDTNAILTQPVLLQVNTVPVDTTLAIKNIKPPYEESYSWLDWLKDNMYVVYGGIVAILLTLIIIYIIWRYRKIPPSAIEVEAPKIPAHIIALDKLEKLSEEKLWQNGKLKQYHIAITDILREYIENRFKIQALEQTTDEILFGFRNVAIDDESRKKLKDVLILGDLVKFAKEQPLPNENEKSLQNSYDFVNGTKRDEEEVKSGSSK
ncbi:MAG: hypothetical protein ACXVP4_06560 [Bacteroidia bacterium]